MKCDCKNCRAWVDESPGPWLTIFVFTCFLAGAWALFSLWGMGELYRTITSTAVNG